MKTISRIAMIGFIVVALTIMTVFFFRENNKKVSQLPTLGTVPEFTLLTQDSATFTKQNLIGHVTIADFIFTTCGGPCPLMSAKMMELQDKFSEHENAQFLSFSVDPDYDTPTILKEYGKKFKARQDKWTFLTGERKAIYSLARYGFKLTVEDEVHAILHSTKFILIDSQGMIRGYYDYEDSTSIQRLINDARNLLSSVISH